MRNPKQRQSWLYNQAKVSFKTIEIKVNNYNNYYLADIDYSIKSKLNNSNGINDNRIEFTSILKNINTINSYLNLEIPRLESLKKTIKKNLKSKKINSFKNFIIIFFTFGKINRNKDIENEISKLECDYEKIKNKSKNIIEKLNNVQNELLHEITKRHNFLEKEKNELIQVKTKLQIENKNYKEKIKQFESDTCEDKSKIDELQQDNQILHKFVNTANIKFIGNYKTLESIIKGQKQEIEIYKQNEELEKKIKLTDSGNESDSDTNNFNKNKINQISVSNKKNIQTRIWKFFNYF